MDFSSKKNVEFICCQCKQMTTLKTCPDCVIKNIIWIGERGLGLIDWPCVQFFCTSSAVIISVFSVTDTNTKLEKKNWVELVQLPEQYISIWTYDCGYFLHNLNYIFITNIIFICLPLSQHLQAYYWKCLVIMY